MATAYTWNGFSGGWYSKILRAAWEHKVMTDTYIFYLISSNKWKLTNRYIPTVWQLQKCDAVCTGDGRSGSYWNFRFTCFICESLINAVSLKLFHSATCLLPWLCLDSKKVFGIALWWLGTISGQTMIFYVAAFFLYVNNEDYFN
jgi:hypothetical protein